MRLLLAQLRRGLRQVVAPDKSGDDYDQHAGHQRDPERTLKFVARVQKREKCRDDSCIGVKCQERRHRHASRDQGLQTHAVFRHGIDEKKNDQHGRTGPEHKAGERDQRPHSHPIGKAGGRLQSREPVRSAARNPVRKGGLT